MCVLEEEITIGTSGHMPHEIAGEADAACLSFEIDALHMTATPRNGFMDERDLRVHEASRRGL